MHKAIDNYAQGKQREVEAWTGSSISASSGRFICPECLEAVALDVRGHFRHKNRTPQSIECDKRVDSTSRSAHERMGLPIYLCEKENSVFSLGVGFSGHGDAVLQEAATNSAYLDIKQTTQQSVRYSISHARFLPNSTTILPVTFLPQGNGAYAIHYSAGTPAKLKTLWTDHSDIWGAGQFFKISPQHSRKVRPLGTIVTDEDYYYIGNTWQFNTYRSFVSIAQAGCLILSNQTLNVYRINVSKSKSSEYLFKSLADMLRNRYKINLLVGESLLSPLWPPCLVEDTRMIFPSSTVNANFYVQTPNEIPIIYRYYGGTYIQETLSGKAPYTYQIFLTNTDIPLCVDRSFNGNIQFICKISLPARNQVIEADVVDEYGISVKGQMFSSLRNKSFKCKTNFPALVHIYNADGKDYCREINAPDGLVIDGCQWNDTISIYSRSGRLALQYVIQKNVPLRITQQDGLLANYLHGPLGPMVPVCPQILSLYKNLNVEADRKLIEKYIKLGYIPYKIVALLRRNYER